MLREEGHVTLVVGYLAEAHQRAPRSYVQGQPVAPHQVALEGLADGAEKRFKGKIGLNCNYNQ